MKLATRYRQHLICGRTAAADDGSFFASGGISLPDPAGRDPAFETVFRTEELYLTDMAAHSGGVTYAKKLIDRHLTTSEKHLLTHVLLVEDSPGDVRLMQEAFRDAKRPIQLHVARDGVDAMEFLKRKGRHADAPRPDIILLDLNMPTMDGREVLALIKGDESLMTIPTLVLTTSEAEADIVQSYRLQANCYLRKPEQWDAFDNVVRSINDFWLTKATLVAQNS